MCQSMILTGSPKPASSESENNYLNSTFFFLFQVPDPIHIPAFATNMKAMMQITFLITELLSSFWNVKSR